MEIVKVFILMNTLEMRLPIDLGSPMPNPPREIRTFAAELAEDLEWSYRVAREVIGLGHRRSETRYNERVVAKQYKPGVLVRILIHTHPHTFRSMNLISERCCFGWNGDCSEKEIYEIAVEDPVSWIGADESRVDTMTYEC